MLDSPDCTTISGSSEIPTSYFTMSWLKRLFLQLKHNTRPTSTALPLANLAAPPHLTLRGHGQSGVISLFSASHFAQPPSITDTLSCPNRLLIHGAAAATTIQQYRISMQGPAAAAAAATTTTIPTLDTRGQQQ